MRQAWLTHHDQHSDRAPLDAPRMVDPGRTCRRCGPARRLRTHPASRAAPPTAAPPQARRPPPTRPGCPAAAPTRRASRQTGRSPSAGPAAAPTTASGGANRPRPPRQRPRPPARRKRGGKVTWAVPNLPNALPSGAIAQPYSHVLVYSSLLEWDRQLKGQPALAESFQIVDDKTYVFKLRQGVKFHDGSEVTVRRRQSLARPAQDAAAARSGVRLLSQDRLDRSR